MIFYRKNKLKNKPKNQLTNQPKNQPKIQLKNQKKIIFLITLTFSAYIASSEPTCSPPDGVDFYWTTCGHPKTGLDNVWFGISKSKYNWEGGKQLCDLASSRSNYTTGLTASYDVEWDFCNYHAVRMLTGDSHSVDVILPGKWIRNDVSQNGTAENIIYPEGWSWCTEDSTAVESDCRDGVGMNPDYNRIQHQVNYRAFLQKCHENSRKWHEVTFFT